MISSSNQILRFGLMYVPLGNRPAFSILKSVVRATGTISKTCFSFSMRLGPDLSSAPSSASVRFAAIIVNPNPAARRLPPLTKNFGTPGNSPKHLEQHGS